jgi:hypothetical protein
LLLARQKLENTVDLEDRRPTTLGVSLAGRATPFRVENLQSVDHTQLIDGTVVPRKGPAVFIDERKPFATWGCRGCDHFLRGFRDNRHTGRQTVDTASKRTGIGSDLQERFRLDAVASFATCERQLARSVAFETQVEHIIVAGATLLRVFVAHVTGQVVALDNLLSRAGPIA